MSGSPVPGSFLTGTPKPGRIAVYVLLAALGALVGIAGSLVQAGFFPGGLALALLASGALFAAGRRATGTQLGAAAPAAGWLLAVVVLSIGRPEGDAVFASGIGPLVFMLGGTAVAVMCATMSRPRQPDGTTGRLGG
ncbi:DUF6113 family protein [Streptomyces sp. t39]|uniref:DUF6113 family protein n=1 Tax=Streptomyces sp. t39 TaxID=1828156 RepID=UPI0011CD9754|nr:DUF6113 family protein [Streptomyces sp. t39]TXS56753.1 hypothetical protein EAO77_12050 [Streptomyces sp. t39]